MLDKKHNLLILNFQKSLHAYSFKKIKVKFKTKMVGINYNWSKLAYDTPIPGGPSP